MRCEREYPGSPTGSLHPEIPGPLDAEVGPGHGVQGPRRKAGHSESRAFIPFLPWGPQARGRVASFLLCHREPEEVLGHTESGVRGPPAGRVTK